MKRTLAATVLVVTGVVGASACDPGPECVDYSTTLHTTTTIVNGKPVVSTVPVMVCMRYADPEPKKS